VRTLQAALAEPALRRLQARPLPNAFRRRRPGGRGGGGGAGAVLQRPSGATGQAGPAQAILVAGRCTVTPTASGVAALDTAASEPGPLVESDASSDQKDADTVVKQLQWSDSYSGQTAAVVKQLQWSNSHSGQTATVVKQLQWSNSYSGQTATVVKQLRSYSTHPSAASVQPRSADRRRTGPTS
jgi:hypothetical protein